MNGTIVLSWNLLSGAESCERDLWFQVFVGSQSANLSWVTPLNTTETS